MYFCGIRSSLISFDRGHGAAFVTPVTVHRKFHISMYFLKKIASRFPPKEKICFRKKKTSFQIIQEKSCPGEVPFERTIFSEHLKKISYFRVFFWERSSFIFRLRGKIIFSGKRNIIFPNNTKKIIFPNNFLRKPIFSGLLKKENMVSAQWKFSVYVIPCNSQYFHISLFICLFFCFLCESS